MKLSCVISNTLADINLVLQAAIPKLQGKVKILYRHFRAKLKHVLWLEDIKTSLGNSSENLFWLSSEIFFFEEPKYIMSWINLWASITTIFKYCMQHKSIFSAPKKLHLQPSKYIAVTKTWWNILNKSNKYFPRRVRRGFCRITVL